ncbi:protein phosphatase 1H isoform X1 [Schistocerca americana]|uniref:protein phosphatase 1H isoform X1 n=1 Tax=Schistocerca americana TaxID=7009 RepID=UPI001F4F5F2C|nr:protein phosphatase 1H isoform X1 [Schistocerca americana]XP_049953331.1 protein phosphatase 1H isoform X1 [Schistocerca serialis cubense]
MFNKLKIAVFNAVSGTGDIDQGAQLGIADKGPDFEKPLKFKYKRPFFLSFTSDEEVQVSADHHSRPIIVPRDTSRLPWHSGYAEAVNAGKSTWNEDQAFLERRELRRAGESSKALGTSSIGNEMSLPYVYFALFDGHAGFGASVAAANQLHHLLYGRLMDVVEQLLPRLEDIVEPGKRGGIAMWVPDKEADKEMLIKGALELAFHDMDQMILEDKKKYRMKGGCTALVALFILGKLFVANAGDSRAVLAKNRTVIPMSHDFTPESERARVRHLAALKPELLGNEFTRLDYIRRPTVHDLGKKILYRDAFMNGWAYKIVTRDDLKYPVVVGEGKRSRVLGTIGVTRGFGDHDLRAVVADVPVKPFLSSQPEIEVFDIEEEDITEWDVLIMGTDGLWDVTSNESAIEIVQKNLTHFREDQRAKYGYTSAAQDLIMQSRGKHVGDNWRTHEGRAGSIDDISVFVIPLLPYKKEYTEWHTMFDAAWGICEPDSQNTFGKLSLRTSPIPSQRRDVTRNGGSLTVRRSVKSPSDSTEEDVWDFDEDAEEIVVPVSPDDGSKSTEKWQELTRCMGVIDLTDPELSPTKKGYRKDLYVKPSPKKLSNKDANIPHGPQGTQSYSCSARKASHTSDDVSNPSSRESTPKTVSSESASGQGLPSKTVQRSRERRDSQTFPPT